MGGPTTQASPSTDATPKPTGRPRVSVFGWIALGTLVVAGTCLALNYTGPWVHTADSTVRTSAVAGKDLHYSDLDGWAQFRSDYAKTLLWFPIAGYIGVAALALFAFVADVFRLRMGTTPMARTILALGATLGAFLVALQGFRWLGFGIHEAGATSDVWKVLWVPNMNLAVGTLLVAGGVFVVAQQARKVADSTATFWENRWILRSPPLTLAVAFVALVLLPLMPFARLEAGGNEEPRGEFVLSDPQYDKSATKPVVGQLSMIRIALWITISLASFSWLGAAWARVWPPQRLPVLMANLNILNTLPWILLVVQTSFLARDLPKIEVPPYSVKYVFNPMPIVACVLILASLIVQFIFVARPSTELLEAESGGLPVLA